MLIERLRPASYIEGAGECFFDSISATLDETPIHTIKLSPECDVSEPVYACAASVIKHALTGMQDRSYVASTVLNYGGTAVVKRDTVLPNERLDDMGWHIDIRKALVAGSSLGTQLLTGDTNRLIYKPLVSSWLNKVMERQDQPYHPEDWQLSEAGLDIETLQPDAWYELNQDVVHRAPLNETTHPVMRTFVGITPQYYV